MAFAAVGIVSSIAGLVSSSLGLISTVSDDFPSTQANTAMIRIAVGLGNDSSDSSHMGGSQPQVVLYDEVGTYVGIAGGPGGGRPKTSKWATIKANAYQDMNLQQKVNSDPAYLQVAAGGNDEICISYIAITFPSGTRQFVYQLSCCRILLTLMRDPDMSWLGDINAICGGYWDYSNVIYGANNNRPLCAWLDGDETCGIQTQGFGIHLPDFNMNDTGLMNEYKQNNFTMCNSQPRFGIFFDLGDSVGTKAYPFNIRIFSPPLQYREDGSDLDPTAVRFMFGVPAAGGKRSPFSYATAGQMQPVTNSPKRSIGSGNTNTSHQIFPGTIVITNITEHGMETRCTSPTSRGPDMVNIAEGLFCDMETKTLYPVCNSTVPCDCLDLAATLSAEGLSNNGTTVKRTVGHETVGNGTSTGSGVVTSTSPFLRSCNRHAKRNPNYSRVVHWR